MDILKRRLSRRLPAVMLAVVASVALSGCYLTDWFKASDTVQRASAFISGLEVQPSTVLCNQSFSVSFSYDDPQDDVSLLLVNLQLTGTPTVRAEQVLWSQAPNLNLADAGRASYTYTFPCGVPGGSWQLTVQLEDRKGNFSNILTGAVSLTSAGGG